MECSLEAGICFLVVGMQPFPLGEERLTCTHYDVVVLQCHLQINFGKIASQIP